MLNSNDVIRHAMTIDGWLAPSQAELLWRLGRDHLSSGGLMAELGVWKGRTAYIWGSVALLNGATVLGIDTFAGRPDKSEPAFAEAHSDPEWFMKQYAQTALRDLPVQLIKATTTEAAKTIKDGSLDICFVDADHREEAVIEDITNYLPKMKKGGILCGHDYEWSSVHTAVNRFFVPEARENVWIHECA